MYLRTARAPVLLEMGAEEAAREEVSAWEESYAQMVGAFNRLTAFGAAAVWDAALIELGDDQFLSTAYQELTRWHGFPIHDHVRGGIAGRLGLLSEAGEHYQRGAEWAERVGYALLAGRNLQGLAELAARRGQQEEAREQLDRAEELFSRHGAKLYLDQVLARKQILDGERS